MSKPIIRSTAPASCSTLDLDAFQDLVVQAGEATREGLGGIAQAESLAFAREDQHLLGVGALKVPGSSHTLRVFQEAGVSSEARGYDLELGWIAVIEECRGQGIGLSLCQELKSVAGLRPVFATTRANNFAMLSVLSRIGFSQRGHSFELSEHPGSLIALLVRG